MNAKKQNKEVDKNEKAYYKARTKETNILERIDKGIDNLNRQMSDYIRTFNNWSSAILVFMKGAQFFTVVAKLIQTSFVKNAAMKQFQKADFSNPAEAIKAISKLEGVLTKQNQYMSKFLGSIDKVLNTNFKERRDRKLSDFDKQADIDLSAIELDKDALAKIIASSAKNRQAGNNSFRNSDTILDNTKYAFTDALRGSDEIARNIKATIVNLQEELKDPNLTDNKRAELQKKIYDTRTDLQGRTSELLAPLQYSSEDFLDKLEQFFSAGSRRVAGAMAGVNDFATGVGKTTKINPFLTREIKRQHDLPTDNPYKKDYAAETPFEKKIMEIRDTARTVVKTGVDVKDFAKKATANAIENTKRIKDSVQNLLYKDSSGKPMLDELRGKKKPPRPIGRRGKKNNVNPTDDNTKTNNGAGIIYSDKVTSLLKDMIYILKTGKTTAGNILANSKNYKNDPRMEKYLNKPTRFTKKDVKEMLGLDKNGVKLLDPKSIQDVITENFKKTKKNPFENIDKSVDEFLFPSGATSPFAKFKHKLSTMFGKFSGVFDGLLKSAGGLLSKAGGFIGGKGGSILGGASQAAGSGITKMLAPIIAKFLPLGAAVLAVVGIFKWAAKDLKKNLEKWFSYNEALSKSTFLLTKGIVNQTKILEANSKQSTKFGLSSIQYVNQASQIGETLRINGLTTRQTLKFADDIIKRAADVGSFSNIDPQKFIDATISAINGERERLKTLGVVINQDSLNRTARDKFNAKDYNSLARVDKATLVMEEIFKQTTFAAGNFNDTLKDSVPNMKKVIEAYKEENSVLSPFNKLAALVYKSWLKVVLTWEKSINRLGRWFDSLSKNGRDLNNISSLNNAKSKEEALTRANNLVLNRKSDITKLADYDNVLSYMSDLRSKQANAEQTKGKEEAKGGFWKNLGNARLKGANEQLKEANKNIGLVEKELTAINDTRSVIQAVANSILDGTFTLAEFSKNLTNSGLNEYQRKVIEDELKKLIKIDQGELADSRALTAEQRREKFINSLRNRASIVDTAKKDLDNTDISSKTFDNRAKVNSPDAISYDAALRTYTGYRQNIIKGKSLTLNQQEEYDILAPMFESIKDAARNQSNLTSIYIDTMDESVNKSGKELNSSLAVLKDNYDFVATEMSKLTKMDTTMRSELAVLGSKTSLNKTEKGRLSELQRLEQQAKEYDILEEQLQVIATKMDAVNLSVELIYSQKVVGGMNNIISGINTNINDMADMIENGVSAGKLTKAFENLFKSLEEGINSLLSGLQALDTKQKNNKIQNDLVNTATDTAKATQDAIKSATTIAQAIPIASLVVGSIGSIVSIFEVLFKLFPDYQLDELKTLNIVAKDQLSTLNDQLNVLQASQQYIELQYRKDDINKNVTIQEKLVRAMEKLTNAQTQASEITKKYGSYTEADQIKANASGELKESTKKAVNDLKSIYGGYRTTNEQYSAYRAAGRRVADDYASMGLTQTAARAYSIDWAYVKDRQAVMNELAELARSEIQASQKKISSEENLVSIQEEIKQLQDEMNENNKLTLKTMSEITNELKKQLDLYKQMMGTQNQLALIGLRNAMARNSSGVNVGRSYQSNN